MFRPRTTISTNETAKRRNASTRQMVVTRYRSYGANHQLRLTIHGRCRLSPKSPVLSPECWPVTDHQSPITVVVDSVLSPQPSVRGGAQSPVTNHQSPPLLNIGCGADLTIRELVDLVKDVVGYEGQITWDHTKPDGTPRKWLDVTRMTALGWTARVKVAEGVRKAYADFLDRSPIRPFRNGA